MDTSTERRFRRKHISLRDFQSAIAFITAARGHDIASIEHEALLLAAIIHYARPFSGNEREKKGLPPPPSDATLDEGLIEFEDPEEFELHERICVLRNKAVAHAEFSYYPVEVQHTEQQVMISRGWHVVGEHLDLDRFQLIAARMSTACLFGVHEDLMSIPRDEHEIEQN